jgi:hypothetical protein
VPSVVYAGEDEGSRQTAGVAGAAFDAKVKTATGLSAMGMGLWEGLTVEELEDRYPKSFRQWRDRPSSVNVPGGEGVGALVERVAGVLVRLLEKHPRKCVCVVLRPVEFSIVDRMLGGGSGADGNGCGGGGIVVRHDVSVDELRALSGALVSGGTAVRV